MRRSTNRCISRVKSPPCSPFATSFEAQFLILCIHVYILAFIHHTLHIFFWISDHECTCFYQSQWRHMGVVASQTTGSPLFIEQLFSVNGKNTDAYQWPHKGPLIKKAFSCRGVIMKYSPPTRQEYHWHTRQIMKQDSRSSLWELQSRKAVRDKNHINRTSEFLYTYT